MNTENIAIKITVDDSDLKNVKKDIDTLSDSEKNLVSNFDKANSQYKENQGLLVQMRERMKELKSERDKALNPEDVKKYTQEISKLNQEYKELTATSKGLVETIGDKLRGLTGIVVAAFAAKAVLDFGAELVSLAAKMEVTRVSFEVMLGSAQKADAALRSLVDFAAKTPFELPGVLEAAKQLLAFGFNAKEIEPTLQKLGDVAAGVGRPIEELANVWGKLRANQTLSAGELNMFQERGIPLAKELAKSVKVAGQEMQVSEAYIKKLASAGLIGFADVEKAFAKMTGAGGQFFGMMEKQSQTFEGKWSTVKDTFKQIGTALGDVLLPAAKMVLDGLQGIGDWFSKTLGIQKDWQQQIVAESNSMNALFEIIKNTTSGDQARTKAIAELNDKYPQYLTSLVTEKTTLSELTKIQNQANEMLKVSIQLKALDQEKEKESGKAIKFQTEAFEILKKENVLKAEIAEKEKQYAEDAKKGQSDIATANQQRHLKIMKADLEDLRTRRQEVEGERDFAISEAKALGDQQLKIQKDNAKTMTEIEKKAAAERAAFAQKSIEEQTRLVMSGAVALSRVYTEQLHQNVLKETAIQQIYYENYVKQRELMLKADKARIDNMPESTAKELANEDLRIRELRNANLKYQDQIRQKTAEMRASDNENKKEELQAEINVLFSQQKKANEILETEEQGHRLKVAQIVRKATNDNIELQKVAEKMTLESMQEGREKELQILAFETAERHRHLQLQIDDINRALDVQDKDTEGFRLNTEKLNALQAQQTQITQAETDKRANINRKYNAEAVKIQEDNLKKLVEAEKAYNKVLQTDVEAERIKIIRDETNNRLTELNMQQTQEIKVLKDKMTTGVLTEKQYYDQLLILLAQFGLKRKTIIKEGNRDELQEQIKINDEKLKLAESQGALGQELKLIKKSYELKKQLAQGNETAITQLTIEENQKRMQAISKYAQAYAGAANQILGMISSQIDAEKERETKQKDLEIQGIDESVNNRKEQIAHLQELENQATGASKMRLQKQIRDLEIRNKQEEIDKKKLEEEKIKIEREANEKKKAIAIAQAVINGALAITNILAQNAGNPILAAILTGVTIATTAAQIATISAQKFAKGKVNIQGEGTGTSDSIPAMISKGESVITAQATQAYLPTLEAIHAGTISPEILNTIAKGKQAVTLNGTSNMDLNPLIKEIRELKQIHVNLDKQGFGVWVADQGSQTKYLNDRYSS